MGLYTCNRIFVKRRAATPDGRPRLPSTGPMPASASMSSPTLCEPASPHRPGCRSRGACGICADRRMAIPRVCRDAGRAMPPNIRTGSHSGNPTAAPACKGARRARTGRMHRPSERTRGQGPNPPLSPLFPAGRRACRCPDRHRGYRRPPGARSRARVHNAARVRRSWRTAETSPARPPFDRRP